MWRRQIKFLYQFAYKLGGKAFFVFEPAMHFRGLVSLVTHKLAIESLCRLQYRLILPLEFNPSGGTCRIICFVDCPQHIDG